MGTYIIRAFVSLILIFWFNVSEAKQTKSKSKPTICHKSGSTFSSQDGIASVYGYESGSTTATCQHFNPMGISAAHKTLPLPSYVEVENLNNGKTLIVLVNDRGPYVKGRIIDLSIGAANQLGIKGLARVRIRPIKNGD